MKQRDIFIMSEAKAWFNRNVEKLPVANDPVLGAIARAKIKPKCVLEIGCANGWRLSQLAALYNCQTYGVDPMIAPVSEFKNVKHGTAEHLSYGTGLFDLVIYGFCLYLCDPEDYLKITYEGDRVLCDGGNLIIYDFYNDEFPLRRPYEHKEGLFSHKINWSLLWLSHPAYRMKKREIAGEGDDQTAVTILHKNMSDAFDE